MSTPAHKKPRPAWGSARRGRMIGQGEIDPAPDGDSIVLWSLLLPQVFARQSCGPYGGCPIRVQNPQAEAPALCRHLTARRR